MPPFGLEALFYLHPWLMPMGYENAAPAALTFPLR